MKRILLVAGATAIPLAVLALVSATTDGQLLERTNYSAAANSSYLNDRQCAGTDPVSVEWAIKALGSTATLTGSYLIFASDQPPPTNNTDTTLNNFCAVQNDLAASPQVHAGQVKKSDGSDATFGATSLVQDGLLSGASIATTTNTACTGNEGKKIYVCAHWLDGNSAKAGYASGTFTVQVAAPAKVANVSPASAPDSLTVRWDASTGGAVQADHYIAFARPLPDGSDTPVQGGPVFQSPSVNGTGPVTISGLQNGQRYEVIVVAYSIGGNPSPDSDPKIATPAPVDGFWQVYQAAGGREQGGCSAGAAGPAAILAVAGLLAALRRRK